MAENNEKRDPSSHRTPGQIRRVNRDSDSLPRKIDQRTTNNRNRREFERDGRVRKGDGKDIDHRTPVSRGGSNARSKLARYELFSEPIQRFEGHEDHQTSVALYPSLPPSKGVNSEAMPGRVTRGSMRTKRLVAAV
jgi:hypothetical protein